MYSRTLRWLASLVALALVAGCGFKVNRQTPPTPKLAVHTSEMQCLSHMSRDIQEYFQATATDAQVEAFWDCASRALEFFTKYVRGTSGQSYAPSDLRAFFELYYLGNLRISDELLAQMMNFKQVLFGRSTTSLEADDLTDIRNFLHIMKQVSLRLRPYVPIYTLQLPASGVDKSTLEAAALQMEYATAQIGPIMASSRTHYKLDDLMSLLAQWQIVFDKTTGWQGPNILRHHMPLFNLIRTMVTAGPKDQIEPEEWGLTLNISSRIFFEWMRFKYVLGQESWQAGPGLDAVAHFAFEALQILEEGVTHQPEQALPYTQLSELLDKLGERNWLPFGLQAEIYKGLLAPLFSKMLRPLEKPDAKVRADALTLDVVHQAQQELLHWVLAQRRAVELSSPAPVVSQEIINEAARPKSWQKYVALFKGPFNPNQIQSISELRRLMTGPAHLLLDSRGALRMASENKLSPYDLASLSALNARRLLIHLALRGYARDPARALALVGLTIEEFHDLFKDVHAVGEALRVLDPREGDATESPLWKTLFLEANLFTYRGNGDAIISFDEGVEILTTALSSGAVNRLLWRKIETEMEALQATNQHRKKLLGDEDVFGEPVLDAVEFRRLYRHHFAEAYSNLPNILRQFKELEASRNETGIRQFLTAIEQAGRHTTRDDVMIEASDLVKFTMVLHYVEAIFTMYDTDQSGGLSSREIMAAMPRFRELLSEQTDTKWEHFLRSLLTFMAKEGRQVQPDMTANMRNIFDLFHLAKWGTWDYMRGNWQSVEVRPVQLIRLFGDVRNSGLEH